MSSRPTIALTVGDPAGIGPEVSLAALAAPEVRAAARVLVLGPGSLRPPAVPKVGGADQEPARDFRWLDTGGPDEWELGRVQASCGRAALAALEVGARLAGSGAVDALVTAPVNKEALHAAGARVEGQTQLLSEWAGAERVQMIAVAGALRVMLLTRHLPLAEALGLVRTERVVEHLVLLDETLKSWGFEAPRLALAGLNPHASEGGLFGDEEERELVPAVARARDLGLDVRGPEPPDTVFARARAGAFDAVLALYHDQAFIPIKLAEPERAFTVLAGLPYLRLSPTHGTAFDIAGRGVASPASLIAALLQAAEWARR